VKKKKIKIDIMMLVLLLILFVLLYFLAELKLFGKRYINCAGYTVFQVVTGSMEPTIKTSDIIIVKLTKDVNENDIITFKADNNFITHRIIEKKNDQIITKGDANNTEDIPITEDVVVGKVVYIITNVAVWVKVFKDPKVIIAIIISILIIKVIFSKDVKNKNSEEE